MAVKKPTMLMILDGFGINDNYEANAILQAKNMGLGPMQITLQMKN